ncbi:hypothetical protein PN462_12215 [Spirulina sp. CS-785/01]|uniref:hypothetical protein n=1 Tax=Spirulina sp. CS-785/01 TaxID=3021716 RepID=UPI00232E847A|nr:hypothetical protein [Spirulina sp. CS-785/01]MDB9313868.1 hypothetical protein [Spirulina sp. CS-785/01]
MEKTNQFNEEIMQSANQQDTESSKVRKGKVGGYAEYLSQDDIEYIDNAIARLGCPFYGVEKP